ncbi:hypothetical protein WA026_009867 [Henosepilachna vigintioctopunctata]|uniref:Uncharacterized protein n=1 Tax=Henosepilachna vigintioctopunctata TaxID=420089 RepID=A0AAW1TRE9_9CUCU
MVLSLYLLSTTIVKTGADSKLPNKILDPPAFLNSQIKDDRVFGYLNGYVNLTCQVEAEPKARFEWLSTPTKVRKTGNVTEYPNQSILQLRLERSTFGKYKCKASNSLGSIERVIILEEGVKPDPPQFLELRGANSNLLDLGIKGPDMKKLNVSDSMKPIGYNVKYRIHRSQTPYDWNQKDFNVSEDNSYVLQELNHNSDYEIAAATRNLAGLSEYSNISIFHTLISETDKGSQTMFNSFHMTVYALLTIIMTMLRRI